MRYKCHRLVTVDTWARTTDMSHQDCTKPNLCHRRRMDVRFQHQFQPKSEKNEFKRLNIFYQPWKQFMTLLKMFHSLETESTEFIPHAINSTCKNHLSLRNNRVKSKPHTHSHAIITTDTSNRYPTIISFCILFTSHPRTFQLVFYPIIKVIDSKTKNKYYEQHR